MNTAAISSLLSQLDREIWLVTSAAGSVRGGLVATFVCNASIVPTLPRMLVGIARQHHTWKLIEASNAFALHVVGEEHTDLAWRFALHSGRDLDKLAGQAVHAGVSGSPILSDTLGWLDCRVEARLETGDRTVYLAEVLEGALPKCAPLLTASRLLQLAPSDRRDELKRRLDHDIGVDARAIEAWRYRQGNCS